MAGSRPSIMLSSLQAPLGNQRHDLRPGLPTPNGLPSCWPWSWTGQPSIGLYADLAGIGGCLCTEHEMWALRDREIYRSLLGLFELSEDYRLQSPG